MLKIGKYSIGIGDRFGHQAKAQLKAVIQAKEFGYNVVPVWNKSEREHITIGSSPSDTKISADKAVKELEWKGQYHIDADHINSMNVEKFIPHCDFFTIDIADMIGADYNPDSLDDFVKYSNNFPDKIRIDKFNVEISSDEQTKYMIAKNYIAPIDEVERIYKFIKDRKEADNFIVEVSIDETSKAQSPIEIYFILLMLSRKGIPVQTIAPKFTGDFFKGIDYKGDINQFKKEFQLDLAILDYAKQELGFNDTLKLSVHSGSDKFSIYPVIKDLLEKYNAGLHLKTAGTTWLEELIGLAQSSKQGLSVAQNIYEKSFARMDELIAPYSTVVGIDKANLPAPDTVKTWNREKFVGSLRHNQNCNDYNKDLRQLLHIGYKIAAEMQDDYLSVLDKYYQSIEQNVIENILNRHIKRVFPKRN